MDQTGVSSTVVAAVVVYLERCPVLVVPHMSTPTDLEVTSDAAATFGYGAYFQGQWFFGPWGPFSRSRIHSLKDFFLVVNGAHLWGAFCS